MMDSYLLLQEKERIVFFSVHFFQFSVYEKTHETKLLRLLSPRNEVVGDIVFFPSVRSPKSLSFFGTYSLDDA